MSDRWRDSDDDVSPTEWGFGSPLSQALMAITLVSALLVARFLGTGHDTLAMVFTCITTAAGGLEVWRLLTGRARGLR
jgi:hypothetical protein